MAQLHQQLSHIQTLAYTLVQKYEEAQNEVEQLRQALEQMEAELRKSDRKLALLENELENARTARGLSATDEDSHLARAKVNSLVREIDRCIALLNE